MSITVFPGRACQAGASAKTTSLPQAEYVRDLVSGSRLVWIRTSDRQTVYFRLCLRPTVKRRTIVEKGSA
jgi:hypothetical protein